MNEILQQLDKILVQRRAADPESSYVAQLHQAGINKILEKVGEESIETILAAKEAEAGGSKVEVVKETADLWFHCMVMLSHLDLDTQAVLDELAKRFDVSGLTEKANRGN